MTKIHCKATYLGSPSMPFHSYTDTDSKGNEDCDRDKYPDAVFENFGPWLARMAKEATTATT